MKFHLDYSPAPSPTPITHNTSLMFVGSCFSENIGKLFLDHAFNAHINPGGIQFNPASISRFLKHVIAAETPSHNTFLKRGASFFSYDHHSSFFAENENKLSEKIEAAYKQTKECLTNSDFLFITFGTAFVYLKKDLNQVVSNCHKQPHQLFEKKLLTVTDIVNDYDSLLTALHKLNPNLRVVFTVSPVKHLRDGLEANSRSKAVLLLSIHQLLEKFSHCQYFPAFELVNDDLRDYRFYGPDMAHPNEEAIQYIWDKFSNTYFPEETRTLNQEIARLNTARAHRPLHHNPSEEQGLRDFIEAQKKRILSLNPHLEL